MKKVLVMLLGTLLMTGCVTVEEKLYLGPGSVLLDVRSEKEYKEGHIKGAILLPHAEIEKKITKLVPDKNTPIFIYCRSGRRAGTALEKLKKLSYKNLRNLGGKKDAEKILLSRK